MADERTPLLAEREISDNDPHRQFCSIIGIPPSDGMDKHPPLSPRSLYARATHQYKQTRFLHAFMASLSTTALLSQVVIGAAITALGASQSSHILITVFGASNTVIAGVVAYLKSRGQPMRTRMFRDDLQRVVDEIQDSEIMWLGITRGIHGYDEIDIDDKVTVRSEVARLMRLYERAIQNNVVNNPDNYLLANSDAAGTALRPRPAGIVPQQPVSLPVLATGTPAGVAPPVPAVQNPDAGPAAAPPNDPDASPASAPPKKPEFTVSDVSQHSSDDGATDSVKEPSKSPPGGSTHDNPGKENGMPAQEAPPSDPDESPASSAHPSSEHRPEDDVPKKSEPADT